MFFYYLFKLIIISVFNNIYLGRLRACSLSDPNSCPSNSKCIQSIAITLDEHLNQYQETVLKSELQHLCCSKTTTFSCKIIGEPFPNAEAPQQCNINNSIACPNNMLCQKRFNLTYFYLRYNKTKFMCS